MTLHVPNFEIFFIKPNVAAHQRIVQHTLGYLLFHIGIDRVVKVALSTFTTHSFNLSKPNFEKFDETKKFILGLVRTHVDRKQNEKLLEAFRELAALFYSAEPALTQSREQCETSRTVTYTRTTYIQGDFVRPRFWKQRMIAGGKKKINKTSERAHRYIHM